MERPLLDVFRCSLPLRRSKRFDTNGVERARGDLITESSVDELLTFDRRETFKGIANRNHLKITAFTLNMELASVYTGFKQCFYLVGLHGAKNSFGVVNINKRNWGDIIKKSSALGDGVVLNGLALNSQGR
tara:strand:- start:591 stop:983 length:393 start_codon:yes stop_codon:yes gene_type:complete